jgi:CheY-like chemotaxis protein
MEHPALIIEGNGFYQNMLRGIFRKLGLRTEIVGDLQAAADIMARLPVSFVMLDAGLPGVIEGNSVPYLQSLSEKATAVILMVSENDPNPVGTQTNAQANGYLVKPFTESEIKNWLIANATVLLGHEWAPSALGGGFGSEFEMDADPATIQAWLEDIRSPDVTAAVDALENLARNRVTQSVQTLIDFSYEAEGTVKIAAIRALGKMGDHGATEAIVANLNHSDQALKESALEALGELRDPRALRPLSRILRVNDKKLVLMAIKALGMLRVPEAKEILGPLAMSGDAQIKANAQWAIRVIDGMDL